MQSISVIIPAYNVENYIEQAIESVLSQTILPNEIIIINDGSTDNTSNILKMYETNELIKIVHTSNNGLGEARNRGLKESSCEYIYFFDSDDLLNSNFIEEIRKNILMYNNPDIILFSGQPFYDEQYLGQTSFFPNYDRGFQDYFNNSYDLISTLMSQSSFFSSACLYISKKDLWTKKNLEFKSIVHEDEDIIFQITAHSESSLVLQDIFFKRRIRNNSIMTSNRTVKNLNGFLISLESMYEFKKKYPILYKELKPLWQKRVLNLTFSAMYLIKQLRKPIFKPVIIKALYDSYSTERAVKAIKIMMTKLVNSSQR